MGFTLPGGFSPTQALKQVGDYAGVYGDNSQGADYDVFSERSFSGGARDPVEGTDGFWGGQQGQVNEGWSPTTQGGYVQGATTTTPNDGGGGGGGTRQVVQADPYAQWGGKANYDAQRGQYGVTAGGYRQGAQTALGDVGNEYDTKTRNFLNTIEDSQGEINRGGAQNQLNLRQSMANIIRGIQTGIRSGGVALAGMNASDSGASEALSRAYAKVGNTQTGEARGQAADEFSELQRSQGQLDRTRDEGIGDLDTWADTETNRVKSDLSSKLQVLDAEAKAKGFNGAVDTGMVDAVVGEAIGRLAQIDQRRQQRMGGIKQWSPDQIIQEAIRMEQQGVAGNAFSVEGPDVNYGGQAAPLKGAPIGRLPIYTKGKDELSTVPGLNKDDKEKTRV